MWCFSCIKVATPNAPERDLSIFAWQGGSVQYFAIAASALAVRGPCYTICNPAANFWLHSVARPPAPSERRHYTGYVVTTQISRLNFACKPMFLTIAVCGECAIRSTVWFCLSSSSQAIKESAAATPQRQWLTQRCCVQIWIMGGS